MHCFKLNVCFKPTMAEIPRGPFQIRITELLGHLAIWPYMNIKSSENISLSQKKSNPVSNRPWQRFQGLLFRLG